VFLLLLFDRADLPLESIHAELLFA
jgi:hypothetical protein